MSFCRPLMLCLALTLAPAAGADPALGTWLSPPDGKKQTGHVVLHRCGTAICGKLERAYDPQGKQIVTRNVGKMLIRDMKPAGGGKYTDGTAWVPIFNRAYPAEMTLKGLVLTVKGCMGVVCKSQTWKRVK